MKAEEFIVVGENIHCTRIVKSGGIKTITLPEGGEGVKYEFEGEDRVLPVPAGWDKVSPAYSSGNIKHVALGIYQALNGDAALQRAGEEYLCYMANRQIAAGARYLDLNVDEYSTDVAETQDVMRYAAGFFSERFPVPLSIDSSNPDTLRIGLSCCRKDIAPPMVNSVSLERPEVAELVAEFGAHAIVNAAGREGMPADADERMANFREVIAALDAVGVPRDRLHLDPLVLPISTDPMNGSHFLEATRCAAETFDGVHLNGGLSNISFGMPQRKLLNMVFMRLCIEAGTDGGIIDPVSVPPAAVLEMDTTSESYAMARAVLVGEDMFGMEYISAYREGRLGKA